MISLLCLTVVALFQSQVLGQGFIRSPYQVGVINDAPPGIYDIPPPHGGGPPHSNSPDVQMPGKQEETPPYSNKITGRSAPPAALTRKDSPVGPYHDPSDDIDGGKRYQPTEVALQRGPAHVRSGSKPTQIQPQGFSPNEPAYPPPPPAQSYRPPPQRLAEPRKPQDYSQYPPRQQQKQHQQPKLPNNPDYPTPPRHKQSPPRPSSHSNYPPPPEQQLGPSQLPNHNAYPPQKQQLGPSHLPNHNAYPSSQQQQLKPKNSAYPPPAVPQQHSGPPKLSSNPVYPAVAPPKPPASPSFNNSPDPPPQLSGKFSGPEGPGFPGAFGSSNTLGNNNGFSFPAAIVNPRPFRNRDASGFPKADSFFDNFANPSLNLPSTARQQHDIALSKPPKISVPQTTKQPYQPPKLPAQNEPRYASQQEAYPAPSNNAENSYAQPQQNVPNSNQQIRQADISSYPGTNLGYGQNQGYKPNQGYNNNNNNNNKIPVFRNSQPYRNNQGFGNNNIYGNNPGFGLNQGYNQGRPGQVQNYQGQQSQPRNCFKNSYPAGAYQMSDIEKSYPEVAIQQELMNKPFLAPMVGLEAPEKKKDFNAFDSFSDFGNFNFRGKKESPADKYSYLLNQKAFPPGTEEPDFYGGVPKGMRPVDTSCPAKDALLRRFVYHSGDCHVVNPEFQQISYVECSRKECNFCGVSRGLAQCVEEYRWVTVFAYCASLPEDARLAPLRLLLPVACSCQHFNC